MRLLHAYKNGRRAGKLFQQRAALERFIVEWTAVADLLTFLGRCRIERPRYQFFIDEASEWDRIVGQLAAEALCEFFGRCQLQRGGRR